MNEYIYITVHQTPLISEKSLVPTFKTCHCTSVEGLQNIFELF